MLDVHKCSGKGFFRHLSKHGFCSLSFRKYISYEANLFFQNVQSLRYVSEMQKKIEKKFLVSEIIAFELVALNTQFYRERILVIGSQYVKKHSQDFRFH